MECLYKVQLAARQGQSLEHCVPRVSQPEGRYIYSAPSCEHASVVVPLCVWAGKSGSSDRCSCGLKTEALQAMGAPLSRSRQGPRCSATPTEWTPCSDAARVELIPNVARHAELVLACSDKVALPRCQVRSSKHLSFVGSDSEKWVSPKAHSWNGSLDKRVR